ncbi:leucine-rich repeat-containing protein 74B-like isoform X2 [Lineus longissimus]|uniref:leucine-rich repeat-containing protein 74B-like isoform X2 n=1 Tax=Lineus longissimus TaxID=88925 RepID=UPI00315CFFB5
MSCAPTVGGLKKKVGRLSIDVESLKHTDSHHKSLLTGLSGKQVGGFLVRTPRKSKEHQNLVSQLCISGYDGTRELSPSNLPVIDPEDYVSDDDLNVQQAREELMNQGSPLSEMYGSIFEMRYGECEDTKEAYDHTGKTTYIEACKKIGVIPVSYFLRNMHNPKLIMKHHGLGPQGVKPICISMVSNTHVVKLSLADNWLGPQGGQHVSEMLKENCFIQEMDLSDNRVGQLFAETLVDLLSVNITMTKLVLSGNELDDKAAIYLAEAIMVTNRLEDLVISHNKFGEKAGIVLGPAIAENMTIKSLDLSWNHIRRKGAVAIAQGIKHNMFLKTVNLSWNGFGLDGAIAIGDALKANSVLDELDISNNRITAEGAVIIGKGLAVNENLKVLKMGKNPMQTAGCYGILAALLKNPNSVMKRLDFSDILVNKDFREMAQQVKEQLPDLNIHTGGDSLPTRPKARIHPMLKLRNYIAKHDLKLIDVFNKWDTDKSMSVTYEEFVAGVEELGLKLEEEEINTLIHELDKDGDGEINYSELVAGETDFTEKERKMKSIISGFKLAVIEAKA